MRVLGSLAGFAMYTHYGHAGTIPTQRYLQSSGRSSADILGAGALQISLCSHKAALLSHLKSAMSVTRQAFLWQMAQRVAIEWSSVMMGEWEMETREEVEW